MASVELTTQQVIDLVRQLPAERKRDVLLALASEAQDGRAQRMKLAEEKLRELSAQKGLSWDSMTDEMREAFVDDLIHEDRMGNE